VYGMATPRSEFVDHCPHQTALKTHLLGPAAKLGSRRSQARACPPVRLFASVTDAVAPIVSVSPWASIVFAFGTSLCGRDDEDATEYECEGESKKSCRRDDDRCGLPAEVLDP
jgi:hypothetical protein